MRIFDSFYRALPALTLALAATAATQSAAADGAPPPEPVPPPPPVAQPIAGEIQFGVAAGGEGSSWHGDGAGFVGIRTGFRFRDLIAPYFLARMGYGTVNERVLELIQLGAQIWGRLGITRPYFRAGFLHQHEEPWAAYKVDLVNSFLGVSDGIAHRNGGEFAVGLDIPFARLRTWQFLFTIEALTTVFPPDNKGPRIYGGGTLGLGFNYGL
jgi:hypothetical protein